MTYSAHSFVKTLTVSLGAFLAISASSICLAQKSASANAGGNLGFKGAYSATTKPSESMTLRCISDSDCTLEVVAAFDGKPESSQMKFPSARRLENVEQVRYAYNYARERSTKKPTNPRDEAMLKQLEPLFARNPEIVGCLDLDPQQPQYVVACKFSPSPWKVDAVIIFGTVLAGCGPLFCRFELIPFLETSSYAK
jgi:hypothetical protein